MSSSLDSSVDANWGRKPSPAGRPWRVLRIRVDRLRVGWLDGFSFGRGTTRAEDAQGTPRESYITNYTSIRGSLVNCSRVDESAHSG